MAEKQTRTKAALGGKKPASKKASKKKKKSSRKPARRLGARDRMTLSRTANNKFNARHEYLGDEGSMPAGTEDHGLENIDELHQHIDDHFGPQGAAPAAGGGPQMPGM